MNQFNWTQTTASQYAKWYAEKVSNPLNMEKVEPEDFIKQQENRIVTYDGVNIDKKDATWFVNTTDFMLLEYKAEFKLKFIDLDLEVIKEGCKIFSTKQKAIDYITFNKPVLALKDIQEILVFKKNPDLINELVKICHERCHGLNKDK